MESTIRIRKLKKDEELKRRRLIKAPNVSCELVIEKSHTDSTADTDLSDGCNSIERSKHVGGKKVRLNSTEETVVMVMSRLREVTSQQCNLFTSNQSIKDTFDVVQDVRRLLGDQKVPHIGILLAHGLLPYLTSLIQNHHHPTILYEIIWCFINLSSSSVPSHVEAVAASGVVYDIAKLLVHGDPGICEHAIWFVANISGDNTQYRDALMGMSIVTDSLLHHMNRPANVSVLCATAWAISNLFIGQSSNIIPLAIRFVPVLVYNTSIGVKGRVPASELVDLMTALLSITECCTETCTLVLESGLLPVLIDAILHYQQLPNTSMLMLPIIRMIWQFSGGTEQQTEQVILSGFLNCGLKLLQSNHKCIQNLVLITLSNVAAGTHAQIDKLLKKRKLMKEIVRLATDGPAEVKKQALWTISNIVTQGTLKQANVMVHHECIAIFCNFLANSHDNQLILVVLEAVEALLLQSKKSQLGYEDYFECCNGIQAIEDLQSSKVDKVYEMAVRIIVNFFGGVEDDESDHDQNMVPFVSETKTTFVFGTNMNEVLAKQLFPDNVQSTLMD
jgi:Atypical Arm repeat